MTAPARRRVCIVTQRYGPRVNGGAEVLMRQLAHKLSARCDVTVATTRAEDYLSWEDVYPAGQAWDGPVRVLRFSVDVPRDVEQFLAQNDRFTAGALARDAAGQARWVWEQGPVCLDLIGWLQAHRDDFDAFLLGPYLYFLTVYGLPAVAAKSILLPMAHDEGPIHMPIYGELFRKARALCYLTPDEQALVRRLFPDVSRLDMVGGAGVELPGAGAVRPGAFREKYGITGPYAVYVGRIEVGKCCDEMFRQWAAYKAAGGPGTLVLMGKSIMPVPRDPSVRALGFVSEEDKYSGIAGADFLWLPSRYESLSIVVLEALALAVPVLVNGGCPVLESHCRKSCAGLWYHSVGGCLAMLGRLFSDGALRRQLGDAGPAYVDRYYRWDGILARLERLMDAVAAPPRGTEEEAQGHV